MATLKYRTAYDGIRPDTGTSFEGDLGKTIQEQKDSTDINNILERYQRTGLIDHVQKHEPQYGEFAAYDFQANQNMIARINQTFEELPSSTRKEFDNNVENFMEFIATQENIDDMKDGVIGNETPVEKPAETTAETTKVSE